MKQGTDIHLHSLAILTVQMVHPCTFTSEQLQSLMLCSVSLSSQWYSDYLKRSNDGLWRGLQIPDSYYEVQTLVE